MGLEDPTRLQRICDRKIRGYVASKVCMSISSLPKTPPSPEALFRRFILGQVDVLVDGGSSVSRALREVSRREHADFLGHSHRVSVSTLKRWRAAFRGFGMAGLEPASRARDTVSDVLPDDLLSFIKLEKKLDQHASVPELLRRAARKGIIEDARAMSRTSVWRAVRRMGLPTRSNPSKREADTRRFAYPHRMQCVLCDGKHFRAGASRVKRVALFFLDDATRYGLDVIVSPSESTEVFITGVFFVCLRYGIADRFYLDRGPGFISLDTHAVMSELGSCLIHGKARYPQGHGKVERFNRTAKSQQLRSLDGAVDVDPDCMSLTLRLRHYLHHVYNDTPHEALDLQTPRHRWESDTRSLRLPESEQALRDKIVVRESRSVSNDHVIQHGGRLWEAPRGLAGQSVEVIRHVLDGHLHVLHQGRMIRLHEVDLVANASDPRGYPASHLPQPDEGVPTTAATLAFNRDYMPLVGKDGGFTCNED